MKKSLPYLFESVRFALILAITNPTYAAQGTAASTAAETSFIESYGLFLAIPAVAGLVILLIARRKSATKVNAPAAKSPTDGLKLRYRERPVRKEPVKQQPVEEPVAARPVTPPVPTMPAKAGFSALPINFCMQLERPNAFLGLPESTDPGLLDAIEQTTEEFEGDFQARSQALELLSTFKTSNSINAIAQLALYDLSSKIRSDAVLILAAMDHESVFETIITACADPTREVRAAAARGLSKLTFDRANAWARIVESNDPSRMRHAARCAIEGGLVERSFDRLVHEDSKMAYEAYALTALLIRSGETEPIFNALARHRDEKVKLALLHVLQTVKDENTFNGLSGLLATSDLPPNVAAKVNEVRSCLQMTLA